MAGLDGWPSIAIVIDHVHPKEKYLRQTKKKFAGISNHYGRPPLFGRDDSPFFFLLFSADANRMRAALGRDIYLDESRWISRIRPAAMQEQNEFRILQSSGT
jgi:hypothetical protein